MLRQQPKNCGLGPIGFVTDPNMIETKQIWFDSDSLKFESRQNKVEPEPFLISQAVLGSSQT